MVPEPVDHHPGLWHSSGHLVGMRLSGSDYQALSLQSVKYTNHAIPCTCSAEFALRGSEGWPVYTQNRHENMVLLRKSRQVNGAASLAFAWNLW